jgi:SNF2 family DNA or RNA helicase
MKETGKLYTREMDGRPYWVIDAPPHVVQRAKRVFPRISKAQVGLLYLSDSPEVCRDLAWFLERYPMEMQARERKALERGAADYDEQILALNQLLDVNYVPPASTALLHPLRDYQGREVQIHLKVGGLLNADDVGLGKTVAAIGSFVEARTLPAVVVTLAHLPKQWRTEIGTFLPGLQVHILQRSDPYPLPKKYSRGPDVVISTYHKLAGWATVLEAYGRSVVFDEVQELRKTGSQRSAAARYLCAKFQYRLGLSATPIYNYGNEIFNILDLLRPGALGTYEEFKTEWLIGDRLKDPRAFGAWARQEFLIVRHTRKDVKRELPAVQRIPQTIDCDTKALDDVQDTAAELARILLRNTGETMKGEKMQAAEQLSNLLRQATGIAKAPHVADFVKLLIESGEKVVLCGWHRAVYDIWAAKLKDYQPVFYTGSETPAAKERSKERFVSGDSRVMFLSLRSGAGLNGLERAASVIVFGELDWSPGAITQCIGRLNRDGQTTPVLAYFLVTEDGSDPTMAETLGIKREQVEGITDPDESFIEELQVDGTRIRALAEAYLDRVAGRHRRVNAGEVVEVM